MKLRIYSDIHLDCYDAKTMWYPKPLPNDNRTTLVIAGDLWTGTKFIEYGEESWVSVVASRFKYVVIVLGNHDYWPCSNKLTITDGVDKCNAMLADRYLHNVFILDATAVTLDEITFIGATLWTDMNKHNPLAMCSMDNYMAYDGKIAYKTHNGFQRFSSEKWVGTHSFQKKRMADLLVKHADDKCVIVTHHLPLHQMGDPFYKGDFANAYYMSDMSDFILDNLNINLWCCGHSHNPNDFMFEHARMYMNPVGYQSEGFEVQGIVKHEVVEV